ncbi:MAG: beta-ketoacyl-[acyl-carrier-protein] synthase family protein [Gammaproteobacteria bacterium]
MDEVSASLRCGRSGIVFDQERQRAGFRSSLTGRINDFAPERYGLSRKSLRTMCEPAQYAYAAAAAAIDDANVTPELRQSGRCGIIFGNDSCVKPAVESIDTLREKGETHFIGSGHIFRTMNSTVTMNLAVALGVRGANWTISAACASGAHAIGQALLLIRSGLQDIVITGGAQETNWQSMASFDALGAFSTRHDQPEKASRPFDSQRDGLVPSGGAACLVIEELSHALARNARVYAVVGGYGFASDGSEHLFNPSKRGAADAMKMALADAAVSPDRIDYINAHATSTPVGDQVEATAIAEVFGTSVPVSSTKSMTGHECWMAGASEVLYTTVMARDGFIAPNINFVKAADDCPKIRIVSSTEVSPMSMALSNSFGFGGTNASLVLDFGQRSEV